MHLTNKDSFVFYKNPGDHNVNYIIGEWTNSQEIKSSSSFIITPFTGKTQEISGKKGLLNIDILISNNETNSTNTFSKEQYINQVEKYIKLCKNNSIDKIVLSRIVKIKNNVPNIFTIFKKLCENYDHSFNYILNHPDYGMWMGASPEILLKGTGENYKTIALAGSTKWNNNIKWREKEIEEQQYVKFYIENVLKGHTENLKCINDLKTIKAGNIAHLSSTFHFNIKSSIYHLIKDLHPTPAVCGIPLKTTKELILNNEIHNRKLYTGFLGEINKNSISLYVNLRCMRINSNEFNIYVGGGITAKSNPKEEWEETEIKAQTMLSLIEN